jgi:multiple sugar transport system substrate-binding protein
LACLLASVSIGSAEAAEKLLFLTRDASIQAVMEPSIERFKEKRPDIEIEALNLNISGEYEKFTVNMREQTNAIDVVLLNDPWVPEFAARGWLQDLSKVGKVSGDFVPNALDVGKVDSVQYAIPWMGNVQMMAYRRDLFEAAGIAAPKTYSDVLAAAEKLGKDGLSGVVFRGVKGDPIVTGFLPILSAFGGRIIDDQGKSAVNSPETVKAIEMMLKLKAHAPAEVASYNAQEVRDALQQGKVAMALEQWPNWVPDLDNPKVSEVVDKVELIPTPGETAESQPLLGVWLLAIPEGSKHPQEALDFINFLVSEENELQEVMNNGKPPVLRTTFGREDVLKKYRWLSTQHTSLETGKPKPRVANYNQIESIMGDYLSLALVGQISPADAAAQMSKAIDRVLAQN